MPGRRRACPGGGGLARPDAGDEAAILPDVVREFVRVERDRHVEEREPEDQAARGQNLPIRRRAAIAFDTSYAQGNSNWAFTQYDNALAGLIAINQRAFDGAISAGQQDVNGWTGYIPAAAAALIIILVLAGVRPRLAEYR